MMDGAFWECGYVVAYDKSSWFQCNIFLLKINNTWFPEAKLTILQVHLFQLKLKQCEVNLKYQKNYLNDNKIKLF